MHRLAKLGRTRSWFWDLGRLRREFDVAEPRHLAVVARASLAAFAMLTASGCATSGPSGPIAETVIPTNATLEAHTPGGIVRVTAVSADTRRYAWGDRDVTVTDDVVTEAIPI